MSIDSRSYQPDTKKLAPATAPLAASRTAKHTKAKLAVELSELHGEDFARDVAENPGYPCRLASDSSLGPGSSYTALASPPPVRRPVESDKHGELPHLASCRSPGSGIGPDAAHEFVTGNSCEVQLSLLGGTADWDPNSVGEVEYDFLRRGLSTRSTHRT
jgi:hypothetical protein